MATENAKRMRMPKNKILVEKANQLYRMLYPYRDALESECSDTVKFVLLINRWPNPWCALQELSKYIPFLERKKLEAKCR